MNKLFTALFFLIIFAVTTAYYFKVIYLPVDILNLFPAYHTETSSIPHNTLVSDPVFQFEPWRHIVKEQLIAGQFPLWNNLNAGGVPLFANAQSAVLFPLNVIYYLLPVTLSLNLIILLKFFLLFTFSLMYLRAIGISRTASVVGSFCIAFSGFPMVWGLWPHTNVFLFLPLFLLLAEKIKKGNRYLHRWFVLLLLAYFLAILGGHYETLVHITLLYSAYIIFRLKSDKQKMFFTFLFILTSFFLAAFQLLPFLEYFFNSYAFTYRTHSSYLYLPFQSFVLNFIPFLSGAPHLQFYRPIIPITNFQESISGYTGVIVIIFSAIGASSLMKKNKLINFWIVSSVFFWLLAFKIWPIGLLLELPIISQAQNSRLSAMAAFSTLIVFSFSVDRISIILKEKYKLLNISFGIFLTAVLLIIFTIEIMLLYSNNQLFHHPYTPQLISHLIFIFVTTLAFLFVLKKVKGSILFALLTIILVGSQTIFLLWNYIPLTNNKQYYPVPEIAKKLQTLSPGNILEVGNPSIPPVVNLMYGISSAENYDGLDIKTYKIAFDKAFPIKNQWNKVDRVNVESLNRFNINYVLSDYDLNAVRQDVQVKQTSIIGPLITDNILSITFIPTGSILKGIRILPANYNRRNSCTLSVKIMDEKTKDLLFGKIIRCANLLDKMFYSLPVPNTTVLTGKKYLLQFKINATKDNAIGLWGDYGKPFVELYYQSSNQQYDYLGSYNNVYLFKIPGSQKVVVNGTYKVIHETPSSMIIEYNAKSKSDIEIKKVSYPGWKVKIDGSSVKMLPVGPFIRLKGEKGRHILDIYYSPESFQVGIFISFLSFIILTVYFLRREFKTNLWNSTYKKFINCQKAYTDRFYIGEFIVIYSLMFLVGVISYISLKAIYPFHKIEQFTTVVNWLTINNHLITEDYLTFGLLAFIIPVCIVLGWLILVWRRNR